ncbi:MAG: DNA polymerase/3'-5' exonuclease PolX [Verrucomicrobiota bacterium]|nr:DNA polymerase/3'-5' exonuclease PolX [Verrucomicrobiota bacterium]
MDAPGKDAIAGVLESIAQLLELKGENPFKVRAYTNAARAIETHSGDLVALAREQRLAEIPGVGKAIAEKLGELLLTGELKYYTELKAEFPDSLFELFQLQGMGAKKIKVLHEHGITSLGELEKACGDGRIAAMDGFGAKTAANICQALAQRDKYAGEFRLDEALPDAETLLADLREHSDVLHVNVAGSYRRRKEIVHDIDLIVATKAPENVTRDFLVHPLVDSVIAQGPTKSSVRLKSGLQADLRVVTGDEYPFALNYFTGSKEHNIVMRNRALKRGWTLNEYRLAPVENPKSKNAKSAAPVVRDESQLYRALGLDYVEPELREDRGEFDAAETGALPELVALENLRGTFHCHTTASDGRSSLEEMAAAAQELGLEYLGIADHSKSSIQAHGLDASQLRLQRARIAELNKTFNGFRLFSGVECDILKDGSLDFPDDVLASLDYVVASVHSAFSLSEAEMTRRIIRAISNPNVTMLGHLTGRLLLTRESYKVDVPAIIDAAAETKTIIELNSNPRRLDMDWRWWPLARQKGVKCAINPDAHHTSTLQHLWFGVAAARKGWLTRADVVNCLPLKKIEKQLRVKRAAA